MVAGVRKALPAVQSLDVTYADVEVSVLGAEYAVASATFRREIVMGGTGPSVKQQGAVSWLAKAGCTVVNRPGPYLTPVGGSEVSTKPSTRSI